MKSHAPSFSTATALGIFGQIEAGHAVSTRERAYAVAWCEDVLAREGIAMVSRETGRIVERVMAGACVSLRELEIVSYDYWSIVGEYFEPPAPTELELA